MRNLFKNKKIITVAIALILLIVGVSVLTNTLLLVKINKKKYWIFVDNLSLNYSTLYNAHQNEIIYDYTDENVQSLKKFRWVEYIGINNNTQIKNLSFLSEMHYLKGIFYNGKNGNEIITEIENWLPLSDCKNLESFTGLNTCISDLSMFKEMKKLKEFYVETIYEAKVLNTQIVDISDIKYLINLEIFEICGNGIDDISNIKYCTKLKEVALYGLTSTDGSALLELPNLESLRIDKGVLTQEQIKTLREKGVEVYECEVDKTE